jgi:signal transduction histidine kinase
VPAEADVLDAAFRNVDSLRKLDAGPHQPQEASADELRASLMRAVAASNDLRRRIERSLHDGAQQQLVALVVNLRLARCLAETDQAALGSRLDDIARDAQRALDDLRQLAWSIYPSLLLDRGLAEALLASASAVDLPTRVDAEGITRHPPDVEAGVYFACLETLHAAAEHVGAGGQATVRVAEDGRLILLDVCVQSTPGSWKGQGLSGVADRVAALGGQLTVASEEGSVRLSAAIPLEQ